MPEMTRREAVAALMSSLYALPHVTSATEVTTRTLFILITVSDGIEFDEASIKNMDAELKDLKLAANCPNLPVLALYGGKIYSVCGPMIPEMNVLPNP